MSKQGRAIERLYEEKEKLIQELERLRQINAELAEAARAGWLYIENRAAGAEVRSLMEDALAKLRPVIRKLDEEGQ